MRASARAIIAIGSNLGDRVGAMQRAVRSLREQPGLRVIQTSFLYETPPMYVTEQPSFLNAACAVDTELSPAELLIVLKKLEATIGRQTSFTNGPRLIDLDILLFGQHHVSTPSLQVPHLRLHERAFALLPLQDIDPLLVHPTLHRPVQDMIQSLPPGDLSAIRRVFPLGRASDGTQALRDLSVPLIMGILNATPDSFSDGGRHLEVSAALRRAEQMIAEGVDVIDVGGESTRPHAAAVPMEEELRRVVPVIQEIRARHPRSVLSVDTRSARVAAEAVAVGADMINDVSGGRFDSDMLATAGSLDVPLVLMHSRGTPQSMSTLTGYNHLIEDVSRELGQQAEAADAFMPRWMQWVDPGLGFAKDFEQNLALLRPESVAQFRRLLGERPVLIGASRKRVVRSVVQRRWAEVSEEDLDAGSVATSCAVVLGGAAAVRVHDVKRNRLACDVMQAIRDSGKSPGDGSPSKKVEWY